mmetsp:Transcript_70/g.123  ORF Transcript_70/g.123 Transcript_70/m.123 type:complete len:309 (+) Transcript_70:19-945(+)
MDVCRKRSTTTSLVLLSVKSVEGLCEVLLFRRLLFTCIFLSYFFASSVLCWTTKLGPANTAAVPITDDKGLFTSSTACTRAILSSAAAVAVTCCCVFSFPDHGLAATTSSSSFRPIPGLTAPTEAHPQITFSLDDQQQQQQQEQKIRVVLPEGTRASGGKDPILQGLVYFLDGQNNPIEKTSPSDTLVLLARRPDDAQVFIAGAKIQISKVRFPMMFALYKENLLIPTFTWEMQVSSNEDVYIDARICPAGDDDAPNTNNNDKKSRGVSPCTEEQSTFHAHGIAKLITQLPGLPSGETVRAAATLQLQ